MLSTGLSEVIGSWKIMAISRPRTPRICSSESLSRSRPLKRIWPLSMRPAGSETRRMMESADTDLPQPDSPTSATVSPSCTSQVTPSTARTTPDDVRKVVRRSFTWRSAAIALGYRVCCIQRIDLGGGEAELGKHFPRVLAEGRRRARHLPGRARKLDRQPERARAAGARVIELDDHLACKRLRIGRHGGDRVDRAAG